MDVDTFKLHVPRLGRHAFSAFVSELFNVDAHRGSFGRFEPLTEAGEDVFFLPYTDSYGGSIHNVYLVHFPPLELFSPSKELDMQDPVLVDRLAKVRAIYKGRKGRWGMVDPHLKNSDALLAVGFITNLAGVDVKVYERTLMPAYRRLQASCGLKKPKTYVGSCDSFLDKNRDSTLVAFDRFIAKHADGIAISLTQHGAHAGTFTSERNLSTVLSSAALPYEPTFLTTAIGLRDILEEFDRLIQSDASEAKLEEFLVAHYNQLFGFAYDRIETQLWLRCPEVDVGSTSRRLDVFLRNSVTNDWELIELKRTTVPLTRTVRDVPTISHQLVDAMHQIKNYARLLAQEKVKRHFAHKGIEYFEPRLTIVIGRTPAIPQKQWRWLKASNEGPLTIMSFDELRKELSLRLTDRYELLNQIQFKVPGKVPSG